jgi:hypothetical protein
MQISESELRATVEAYIANKFDKTATARAMGQSRGWVRRRIERAAAMGLIGLDRVVQPILEKDPSVGVIEEEVTDGGIAITSRVPRIRTVDDLIADRKIDLEKWKIDRAVVNQWEVGAKMDDGTILVEPLCQVKLWLSLIKPDDVRVLGKEILDEISRLGPLRVAVPKSSRDGLLFEFNPADLHIGKLAWHEETGEDYDSQIAASVCLETLEDCISQLAGSFSRSLLIVGNDLLHCDNMESATTKGTRVDADTRYHKMFRLSRTLMIRVIERMSEVAPVDVKVIPGNHDRVSAFTLGEVLSAYYRNDGYVKIDNGPARRKYYRFGKNITGYTHMCDESEKDLPLIMAADVPRDFAECPFKAFRVGHFHKKRERVYNRGDTHGGVEVQVVPSLSGTDAFHFDHGYVGAIKASMGFVIDPDRGIRNTITSRPTQSLYKKSKNVDLWARKDDDGAGLTNSDVSSKSTF